MSVEQSLKLDRILRGSMLKGRVLAPVCENGQVAFCSKAFVAMGFQPESRTTDDPGPRKSARPRLQNCKASHVWPK